MKELLQAKSKEQNSIIKRLVQILINENVMASKNDLEKLKEFVILEH